MGRVLLFIALFLVVFAFVMTVGGFGAGSMALYFLMAALLLSILAQLIPFPP